MPQSATYFPFGPVDVNEYDPHKVSANLQDQLKSVAVRLKRYGLDGKKIGFALKELEDEWVKNNFKLDQEQITNIINKAKDSNILNI